jgi:hypothetical protein
MSAFLQKSSRFHWFTLRSKLSNLAFIVALVQAFLTFIAALVWPVTVIVVVLVFRKEIATLLRSQVKRVKAGPFEMEWEPVMARLEVEVDSAQPLAAPPLGAAGGGLVVELADLARIAPDKAVMEAYSRVESRLLHLLETRSTTLTSARSPAAIAIILASSGVISRESADAVKEIATLRNLVVHGQGDQVTTEQAMKYLGLIDRLLALLPE